MTIPAFLSMSDHWQGHHIAHFKEHALRDAHYHHASEQIRKEDEKD